jgi:ribosomal-protein-alanine N-acetyltransferase
LPHHEVDSGSPYGILKAKPGMTCMTIPMLKMPRPVPVLEGEIVSLRPIQPKRDAQDYYEMNLDPEMHRWTGNKIFESADEAKTELERLKAIDEISTWMIVDKSSGKVVGRFFICLEERQGRLIAGEGVRIARPCWRKGHNKEARRLIFKYVFDTLSVDCIETECWSENINSVLSVKANGFVLIEEITAYNEKYKKQMKKSLFRLTRQDWQSRFS